MSRPTFEQIYNWLHIESPYAYFPLSSWPLDLFGYTNNEDFLRQIVATKKPRLVIEVGSFQGRSSIIMAEELKKLPHNPGLVCVDTWLGAREFWTSEGDTGGWWNQMNLPVEHFRADQYARLRLKNGYPTLYYQFLANVLHMQCDKYIVPYPQTSVIAGRWFAAHGVRADLIYIDGSHDYEDVTQDLRLYWEVLEDGGAMFGDDYWIEDVRKAVDEFVSTHALELGQEHPYWWVEKPRPS